MAEATGLVLIKTITYRGDPTEEFSNKYWLTGQPPQSSAAWKTLADQLWAQERQCFNINIWLKAAYGYDDNAETAHTVWSHDYGGAGESTPGTLAGTPGDLMAGDQAGLIWFRTERRSSKGKWIYLRKYMHGGYINPADSDKLSTATLQNYLNFAIAIKSVAGNPTGRMIRSQKQDEVITLHDAEQYVTTRTLKRRGKRPLAPGTTGFATGTPS